MVNEDFLTYVLGVIYVKLGFQCISGNFRAEFVIMNDIIRFE